MVFLWKMNAKDFDKEVVDYRSFSIFSSGCKQPNFSTVMMYVVSKSAAKVIQKNDSATLGTAIFLVELHFYWMEPYRTVKFT